MKRNGGFAATRCEAVTMRRDEACARVPVTHGRAVR
jgi:hypothetical protein